MSGLALLMKELNILSLYMFKTKQSEWLTSLMTLHNIVQNMSRIFTSCKCINRIDLATFDESIITSMNDILWRCSSLSSLDLSTFNAGNVTDMSYLSYGDSNLDTLDLSSLNKLILQVYLHV